MMIGHLTGTIVSKDTAVLILSVAGVGYEIEIPLSTFYELPAVGSEVSLHIHTNVREDAIQLFGFHSVGEKLLFRRLVAISGVGPKLAMAIIGSMGPSEFLGAIDAGEISRIVQIPGVGKKTAERLIVELKDKLAKIKAELDVEIEPAKGMTASLQVDVISTLENLGYKQQQAEKAVRIALVDAEGADFETLLRKALSVLTS